MNQWNEVMDGWMGGWVNEWMDGRATWLCWATSSLSDLSLAHLFSQLLLWTTSALSCLPLTSFVACATQLFSLHSCCNGFGNLQLQSCLPGAPQQQWCFAAHSRAGASHQINQCSRSAYNGDDSALLRRARLLAIFITNRALATVLCAFCRPHLPKVPRMWQSFNIFKCRSSSRYVLCTFCWQLSQIEPRNRKQRLYFGTPEATLPEKTIGFGTRERFHPWIHTFPDYHSPLPLPRANDDDMMLTWWWQDCPWTFVRNSEVFELNFLWPRGIRMQTETTTTTTTTTTTRTRTRTTTTTRTRTRRRRRTKTTTRTRTTTRRRTTTTTRMTDFVKHGDVANRKWQLQPAKNRDLSRQKWWF